MKFRRWSSLRWTKSVSWTQPLHGWWRICVTCHLSLPCCSINLWTPAVSRRNSSRQSSDHFWRKTGLMTASWRISGRYPTYHLSQSCWIRLFRCVFRHSSTAMDWCLECSLHIADSTARRRQWRRCSAICWLLQTVVRCWLFACLTSQQPLTLSIMTCCCSGLNTSLDCVASC